MKSRICARPARRTLAVTAGTVASLFTAATGSASASTAVPGPVVSGRVTVGLLGMSGARVTAVAWPNMATLDSLADDAEVPLAVVATTAAGAHGLYTLAPDVTSLAAMYREPDGAVNVQIDASTASSTQTFGLPFATPGSAVASDDTVVDVSRPASLAFDLGGQTVTSSVGDEPATTTPVAVSGYADVGPDAVTPAAAAPNAVSPDGGGATCTTVAKTRYPARKEVFMNVYTDRNAHAVVTEKSSSSHTLGIGSAIDNGGWGAAGTASYTTHNDTTVTMPYTSATQISNQVNMRKFDRICGWVADGVAGHQTTHFIRASGGFYSFLTPGLNKSIYNMTWTLGCEPYPARSTFTKSHGKDYQFSTGLSAPYLSLSAQAAYSTSTEVTSSPSAKVLICPSNSQGLVQAPMAGARTPVTCTQKPCPEDERS